MSALLAVLAVLLTSPPEPSCLELASVQWELSQASGVGVPDAAWEAAAAECTP